MDDGRKIVNAKEALKLFVKSLPPLSKFQIISFGSNYSVMQIGNVRRETWDNSEQNVQGALDQISRFGADMGGTEIISPYTYAVDTLSRLQKETRIFLLTDGDVSNPNQVIEKAKTNNNIRTYTFGIGSGCNKDMVQRTAENGRGSCSLVDDQAADLKSLVITALQHASEPSLQDA